MVTPPVATYQIEDTARLREYLGIIRVRIWSVVLITLLALLASLFYVRKQPNVFTSSAQIQATNPIAVFLSSTGTIVVNMGTEQQLMVSTPVQQCAWAIYNDPNRNPNVICRPGRLGDRLPPTWFQENVSTDVPTLTTILVVSFTNPQRVVAQAAAQAYAESYVTYKYQQALDYIDALRKPLESRQRQLTDQVAQLNEAISNDIATRNQGAFQSDQAQLNQLNNELSVVQQQLVTADPGKIQSPTIVVDAPLPQHPSNKIFKILVIVVGFVVGLSVAIAQAFIRYRLDDRLRGRNDLEARLGAPALAIVPHVRFWIRKSQTHLVTVEHPWSPPSEAYRALRTSIMFAAALDGAKVIMVTSPGEGEGKTTTASNLAVVLAEAGRKTVIVNGDLRKPRLGRFFHQSDQTKGLTDVLDGHLTLDEALQDTQVPNLQLLGSGPVPENPSEILLSKRLEALIDDLRSRADFVIIDTTPLLMVADALTLSRLADTILFVANSLITTRTAVASARKELAQLETAVVGAVLNNFEAWRTVEYGTYANRRYRYGYGARRAPAAEEPPAPQPASVASDGSGPGDDADPTT